MKRKLNVIGAQVRRFRNEQRYTLDEMAARCQVMGFAINSSVLSHIESQTRTVTDLELFLLAKALGVDLKALSPSKLPTWSQRRSP